MERTLRRLLKKEIEVLVCQEVRCLKLRQICPPEIVRDGVAQSIQETKREIVRLIRSLDPRERDELLRRMIEETVDEEIDRAIELRRHRCLRCIHGRFYDRSDRPYRNLPPDEDLAHALGCDRIHPASSEPCSRFVEADTASLEDYLDEITFLYEFREMIEHLEELWRDYFLK